MWQPQSELDRMCVSNDLHIYTSFKVSLQAKAEAPDLLKATEGAKVLAL